MKKLFICLLACVVAVFAYVPEADARRMGGGSSFGMQRNVTPPAQRAPSAAPQRSNTTPAATPKSRSWLGPIAGIAAGLGLAALFSHLGLGEEMASFFMLLLLVFAGVMLFRFIMRKMNGAQNPAGAQRMQYASAGSAPQYEAPQPQTAFDMPNAGASTAAGSAGSIPADFDAEAFAREAKIQFIRLQAAHDAGNLDDIRAFTTPEVFAEIHMQMSEHQGEQSTTDVIDLAAEVLDVATEADRHIVSVHFHGNLREERDAPPAPFDEIWHMTKPLHGGSGWLIAGIQQMS